MEAVLHFNFGFASQGHPYMESLRENKALLYSLIGTGSFIFLLASGVIEELDEQVNFLITEPSIHISR